MTSSASVPVTVVGDERWLRQLLFNLTENALKFTAAAPGDRASEVRVAVSAVDSTAVLSVRDSGPGIAEEDLDRVFERFYRADGARSDGPAKGFGLGLSIAAWIVGAHGGTIRALRPAQGGTELRVTLPLQGSNEARGLA